VLDASALLAALLHEPGSEGVKARWPESALSTVNLAEVLQRSFARGLDTLGLVEDLEASGIEIMPFSPDDAETTANLWPQTRRFGLSLADRACLTLAMRLGVPAMTADRAWSQLQIGIDIQLIR